MLVVSHDHRPCMCFILVYAFAVDYGCRTMYVFYTMLVISQGGGAVNHSGVRGNDFSSSVISGLAQGSGEYFTRLGVGTPPDMFIWCWIKEAASDFRPSKSKSFARVPCRSLLMQARHTGCDSRQQTCLYQVSYGLFVGEFSTETLTFRGSSVGGVALGCGHDNEGLFVGAAGLLGLGRGRLSFPSQTGGQFGRKFSYCLVDRSASSRPSSMVFGDAAISQAARFTPLLSNPKLDTFYYVELLGFSIGGTRVPGITASLFKLDPTGEGGVIIDSGTSVTRLTAPAYTALRNAFRVRASNLYDLAGSRVGFSPRGCA
ncbi:hypothetical protein K2173_003452 [Erythroxylum novogranatense]|uniref:Peptidase A1 domain-containing protein n=1 Tax=Erythroxylum novogranatense TaxID=1862640 RepID=A0AAV8S8M7_9ROSI|nr:hypothetical protein K2173_003452 [Erythroxylum novogranatense]